MSTTAFLLRFSQHLIVRADASQAELGSLSRAGDPYVSVNAEVIYGLFAAFALIEG